MTLYLRLYWEFFKTGLFAIGGVVADEYGLSGATIYGGKTGLYMAWARMFLLLAGSFLAFLHIFED